MFIHWGQIIHNPLQDITDLENLRQIGPALQLNGNCHPRIMESLLILGGKVLNKLDIMGREESFVFSESNIPVVKDKAEAMTFLVSPYQR